MRMNWGNQFVTILATAIGVGLAMLLDYVAPLDLTQSLAVLIIYKLMLSDETR